jgi:hypothetical protein
MERYHEDAVEKLGSDRRKMQVLLPFGEWAAMRDEANSLKKENGFSVTLFDEEMRNPDPRDVDDFGLLLHGIQAHISPLPTDAPPPEGMRAD